MTPFRADLHCHSTFSDGTLTPEQILLLASKIGLNALSITDHDTIDAYTDHLKDLAKELQIELITGIEFSTVLDGTSVHLLGYRFALDHPKIQALCMRHKNRRVNRNREILKLLADHGMPIDEEAFIANVESLQPLQANRSFGRPHIAMMMIKLGYVENIQEAFNKYIGDGRPCYAQGELMTAEETIQTIHEAGGVAVIAHPHLIKDVKILNKLLKMNMDGIECYYARFHMKEHQRWLKIAQHHLLLITGGSDFHGEVKPTIPLGCSWIDEDNFRKLQNYDVQRSS